ncbi:hypothetical protein SAMN04490186_3916 [Pseudomonas grimontii]|uniref:Uncharacterized protein n=1 Tax=Pseudomonas grimontii TaxID=129847 RepID=A0A1H1H293_9PSED|nr:hypothetical protein [Pseudomonas grimontii]TWR67289.1 hypothetical protein FIV39_11400 [Pseudomonas grimontii]SDR19501.1 hypothetical protein SAMN04490186_3916 [Pseudomonas grimontii]
MGDWNVGVMLPAVVNVISFAVGALVTLHVQKMARSASDARLDKDAKARRLDDWLSKFLPMASEFISIIRVVHDWKLHAEHRKPYLTCAYHEGAVMSAEAIRWSDNYFSINRELYASRARLEILTTAFKFNCEGLFSALSNAMAIAEKNGETDREAVDRCCAEVLAQAKLIYEELYDPGQNR